MGTIRHSDWTYNKQNFSNPDIKTFLLNGFYAKIHTFVGYGPFKFSKSNSNLVALSKFKTHIQYTTTKTKTHIIMINV